MKVIHLIFNKLKNDHYLNCIRETPCFACYITRGMNADISHAHHEGVSNRFKQYKRMCDYTAIPLCAWHHQERHQSNSMDRFWITYGEDKLGPYYLVIHLLEKYSKSENLPLDSVIKKVLKRTDTRNGPMYYTFDAVDLGKFIDDFAVTVHYQYTTGNRDSYFDQLED